MKITAKVHGQQRNQLTHLHVCAGDRKDTHPKGIIIILIIIAIQRFRKTTGQTKLDQRQLGRKQRDA
jgi:hypothetical protein